MSGSRTLLVLSALVVVACAASCTPAATATEPADVAAPRVSALPFASNGLAAAALWDDGQAEVNRYATTRRQYGVEREFESVWIVVKESFAPDVMLKADSAGRSGTVDVLKHHWLFTLPAGAYPYHHATSTFTPRTSPWTVWKAVTTSTEWCGIVTKSLRADRELATLEFETYYESEGSGSDAFAWPDNGVTEEQLLFAVRTLDPTALQPTELQVLDRLPTSHHAGTRFRIGTLELVGETTTTDANGASHDTVHYRISLPGRERLEYFVERAFPHRLIAHTGPGGLSMRLEATERDAYWR